MLINTCTAGIYDACIYIHGNTPQQCEIGCKDTIFNFNGVKFCSKSH